MIYAITEADKNALLQSSIIYNYRLTIEDDEERTLKVLDNIQISSCTVDSQSSVRRSLSLTINNITNIDEFLHLYMRMNFVLEIGVFSYIAGDYMWYPCGTYVMSDASTTWDETTNSLSTTLSDWWAKMDGTRNGQVGGSPTIIIEQKDSNGNLVTMRNALRNFITAEEITDKILIEDIGEFYGQESTNPDGYEEYRKNHPEWNTLPYDLEFSAGDTQSDMISEFVELYPNVQGYYDVYNNFCCNMIPSCNNDPVILDNDYIQKILVASNTESTTYDIGIKNVTEVFGKTYDVDRTSETCTISNNVFNLTLDKYEKYEGYDIIAFTPTSTNSASPKLQINSLSAIPIYNEYTTTPIAANTLIANEMNTIRIKFLGSGSYAAYYLGQFQPHALCVLTNDVNDTTYTKKYFQDKYNCKNVTLRLEGESPFVVQKMGEILDVKTGDEYDSILSDSVCAQNAIYQNRKASSMNETITITTLMIPWLDVNVKVQYKKANSDEPCEYIVQSISHDLDQGTSNITLQKFYPLYYE